jgi:hypothetical protein
VGEDEGIVPYLLCFLERLTPKYGYVYFGFCKEARMFQSISTVYPEYMNSRYRPWLDAILPVPYVGVGADLIVAMACCHVADVTYVGTLNR